MLLAFFKWWYGPGWFETWRNVGRSIKKVELAFSIPILAKNLFAPWKRIITFPGKSIDEKFRAAIDNLVSRTVGFCVRLCTLVAAAVVIGLSALFGLLSVIAWPLLPAAFIYFVIRTIVG